MDQRGIALSWERGEEIEAIFKKRSFNRAPWNSLSNPTTLSSACLDHANAVKARLNRKLIRKKHPSLILDCANGTVARIAPDLFKSLGCQVNTLNSQMDGTFPGRPSEPTEANIQDLISSVKSTGADMGIAWDGDGDRVVFIDERGEFVIGDKIFALCVQYALKKRKGDVVTTVATSNAIKDLADSKGVCLYRTKVGAPYISEEILKRGAVIGGEEVGGVVWPSVSYGKDGIMTAAKIVELTCTTPLSELWKSLPVYYNSKTKVQVKPGLKEQAMERVKNSTKGRGKATFVDGVRIDFSDSWVIIRPSGTENYLRIFAEAKSKQKAESLMKEYAELAQKASA